MIRVLHSVSNMARAGIETFLMNYYREMDRSQIQFDFLANKPTPGEYDEEIRAMGGRVFVSPGLNPLHFPQYERYMADLLHSNPDIKIVHSHNGAMGYYAVKSAKDAGLPIRIAHAHNTQIIRDSKYPLKLLCIKLLPGAATDWWGCGRDAGIYYFGKKRWAEKGVIMHNAIDPARFAFSEETRARMRRELQLDGKFAVGHVGRFNLQKNHKRLLDIFAALLREKPNAVLLLAGEGELEEPTRQKALALGVADKVRFLGVRSDIPQLCMAMDVFVLPSLFEGLPVVGVEAQASGLPCVFSEETTDEVVILPQSSRLPLRESDEAWANRIAACDGAVTDRAAAIEPVRAAGYDINAETAKITAKYLAWAQRKA